MCIGVRERSVVVCVRVPEVRVRVTGFKSDSRVPVRSQSRKRSKYRKLSTRNRVYRAGVNQVYRGMNYSEDGCKSLWRGTRMQNGGSNEGTNERFADRLGVVGCGREEVTLSLGSIVGAGAMASGHLAC
jgi:hypothetical protein